MRGGGFLAVIKEIVFKMFSGSLLLPSLTKRTRFLNSFIKYKKSDLHQGRSFHQLAPKGTIHSSREVWEGGHVEGAASSR